MANFGFGLGDIVLVCNYAYSVYKSCKNAGDNFKEITKDINSLRSLLLAVDNEYKDPLSSFQQLPPTKNGELIVLLQDCKADLRAVKTVLHDFRSLQTTDPRYRDRLAFTAGKQAALRDKIATHGVRLQQLLSGLNIATFSRIERNTEANRLSLLEVHAKLDLILEERRAGKREPMRFYDAESVVALEDEVLDDRMTEPDVDVSMEIHDWIDRLGVKSSQRANAAGRRTRVPKILVDAPLSENDDQLLPSKHCGANRNSESGVSLRRSQRRALTESRSTAKSRGSNSKRSATARDSDDNNTITKLHTRRILKSPRRPTHTLSPSGQLQILERQLIDTTRMEKQRSTCNIYDTRSYYFDKKTETWTSKANGTSWVTKLAHRNRLNVSHVVDITLEDVCTGITKPVILRRARGKVIANDTLSVEDILFDLNVGIGCLNDAQIRLVGAVDRDERNPVDVLFKLRRLPHATFYDDESLLVHEIRLTAREAAEDWSREVRDLCGHRFRAFATGPVGKDQVIALKGHGLPNSHTEGGRGTLYLTVKITGPEKDIFLPVVQVGRRRACTGSVFFARLCGTEDRLKSAITSLEQDSLMAKAADYFEKRAQILATED